uniref:Uncharacterized protein n=1 Tax=Setaria viridis TaxID=4556 RepID=A0A4U6TL71_SETVI|nr:hypothetical protein SEVIR_7G015800v2 [Setaria viridis]
MEKLHLTTEEPAVAAFSDDEDEQGGPPSEWAVIDKSRALEGSPWMVDEKLKPSEFSFEHMAIWVHILNLLFGWMNGKRGCRVADLIGKTIKLDVDANDKESGPFLRVRVDIEINRPLRPGVMLQTKKDGAPEWFHIQFEKLPFYYFSCGLIGHSELVYHNPAERNALGKLPYEIKLCAQDDK